jgi:hypothetical protein
MPLESASSRISEFRWRSAPTRPDQRQQWLATTPSSAQTRTKKSTFLGSFLAIMDIHTHLRRFEGPESRTTVK